ncbi:MAG: hypothetical protein EOP56_09515 [Sphingobacteriales bacterium]|nr:MAG: hypothetical protein EOP56_09515 [Sphingobacteriales bacterium]
MDGGRVFLPAFFYFQAMDLIDITFEHYGVSYHVEVSQPGGVGSYHVFVNRYFVGQVVERPDGWFSYVESELLYSDDILVILEAINLKGSLVI